MAQTKIMGIVNVTPDSFYDGGKFYDPNKALAHALTLIDEGADILDIGGESSRPGATAISLEEELSRVIPVIEAIRKESNIPLSIDTVKPEVAAAAIQVGATMINDVSGFQNPEMRKIAATHQLPICLMHRQGEPKTMQDNPTYPKGVVSEVLQWFEEQIMNLKRAGIQEEQIILDPGIGFGKTVADNCLIIDNLHRFRGMGFPILLGLSRKSFIYKTLGLQPADVLEVTIALNTIGILQGVEILRVHDVREHHKVVKMMEFMNGLK